MDIGSVISTSYSPQIKSQNVNKELTEYQQVNSGIQVMQQETGVKEQSIEPDYNPSKEKLEEVIKGMNQFLAPANTSLKFTLHEELKEYYVAIVDDKTKEVIREIPPKKLLDMYAAMKDFIGIIFDRKI